MKSRIYMPDFIRSLQKEGYSYWIIKPKVTLTPQRGSTCGMVSAHHSLKLFSVINPDYPQILARKGDVTPRAQKSLRSFYKQAGISGIGAVFDTDQFKLFLNPAGYNAETVSFENQAEMSQILLHNIMQNKPVVIACDTSGQDAYDMNVNGIGRKIIGTKGSGEHPHYITIFGYYQKKDGSIHYVYASWGEWLQVSENDLFLSSNSLKMFPGCTDYKIDSSWQRELPKNLTNDDINKLNKYITPATDLSKIRNRCILITPKAFNKVAHYSKALTHALSENYPLNIDVINTLMTSGAEVNSKDLASWLITPKDLTQSSIIKTATIINQLMQFVLNKNNEDEVALNEFIQLMKDNAVRMDVEIDDEYPLLHRALMVNNIKIIPYLIQYGINLDLNAPGFKQKTILHYAVKQDIKIFHYLLKQNNINLDAKDEYSQTPLHDAVLFNKPEIILALLDAGANVNAEDIFNNTALIYAIINRKQEIVSAFMEHKSVDLQKLKINGECILHTAIKSDVNILHILLKKYKNHLYEKNSTGNTLLHIAALEGKFDIMKYLIEDHQFDINSRNIKGETALYLYNTAKSRKPDNIQWMLERGAVTDGIYDREVLNLKNALSNTKFKI